MNRVVKTTHTHHHMIEERLRDAPLTIPYLYISGLKKHSANSTNRRIIMPLIAEGLTPGVRPKERMVDKC